MFNFALRTCHQRLVRGMLRRASYFLPVPTAMHRGASSVLPGDLDLYNNIECICDGLGGVISSCMADALFISTLGSMVWVCSWTLDRTH